MQFLDLRVVVVAGAFRLGGKGLGHIVDGLPLPVGDLIEMHSVAAAQLLNGLFALDLLQGNLGLELGGVAFAFRFTRGFLSFVSAWLSTLMHCPKSWYQLYPSLGRKHWT